MTLNARRAVLALLLDLMMGIIQPEKNVTSTGHDTTAAQTLFRCGTISTRLLNATQEQTWHFDTPVTKDEIHSFKSNLCN